MMKSPAKLKEMRCCGFTLVELLSVICILALLASLVMPAMENTRKHAHSATCFGNLRQIGVAMNLYIADHDNTYPCIETDPTNPILYADQPDTQAKSMLETFRPYAVTEKTLQCPSDLRGPNYYAKKGTSYEWRPMLDDDPKVNPTTLGRRGAIRTARPSAVRQVTDFTPVHNGRMNVLYGDGHVVFN